MKLGGGVVVPANINNRVKSIKITSIKLPNHVYHLSTTPISSFNPNRIFYVSFSKLQAFLHLAQYRSKLRKLNSVEETKIYFYTLTPRRKNINVILFDKSSRPKTLSNGMGITYNIPSRTNNMTAKNFREGSGDNMILGQILCSKISNLNGIRDEINQDELAFCNPLNFFTIYDKEVLNIGMKNGPGKGKLPSIAEPNIVNIKFQRNANGTSRWMSPYGTDGGYLNLLHKYGTSKTQEARAKQALSKLTGKMKFGNVERKRNSHLT